MADLKISELTETNDPGGLFVPGARAGVNFKLDVGAIQQTIDDHIADTSGAHAGSAISNTPAGGISATNVQSAINELDTEKENVANKDQGPIASSASKYPSNDAVILYAQPLDFDLTAIAAISPSND